MLQPRKESFCALRKGVKHKPKKRRGCTRACSRADVKMSKSKTQVWYNQEEKEGGKDSEEKHSPL